MDALAEKKEPREPAVILYALLEQLVLRPHSLFEAKALLAELKETMPKEEMLAKPAAEDK